MFDETAKKMREKFESLRLKINFAFESVVSLIRNLFEIFLELIVGLVKILVELWKGCLKISKEVMLFLIIFFPILMLWLIGNELSSTFGSILVIFSIILLLTTLVIIILIIKEKRPTQIEQVKERQRISGIVVIFIIIDLILFFSPGLIFTQKIPRNNILRSLRSIPATIMPKTYQNIRELYVVTGTVIETGIAVNVGDTIIFKTNEPFFAKIQTPENSYSTPIIIDSPIDTFIIHQSGRLTLIGKERTSRVDMKIIAKH